MTDRATARLSADGNSVTLSRGDWSQVIKADDIPRQLRFYREMVARKNPRTHEEGAYAAFYRPTLEALERAARAIQAMKGIKG